MPKSSKAKQRKINRTSIASNARVQLAITELRTALYGINGTGGIVRETARILEELKGEIKGLREFRHDYVTHATVITDRLNSINIRLADVAGALPFKRLVFAVNPDQKDRLTIKEE